MELCFDVLFEMYRQGEIGPFALKRLLEQKKDRIENVKTLSVGLLYRRVL